MKKKNQKHPVQLFLFEALGDHNRPKKFDKPSAFVDSAARAAKGIVFIKELRKTERRKQK